MFGNHPHRAQWCLFRVCWRILIMICHVPSDNKTWVEVHHGTLFDRLLGWQKEQDEEKTIGDVQSEEMRRAAIKKLPIITFAWRSKGEGLSAAILFFASSSFVRVLQPAIYAGVYAAAPFSSLLTAALTTVRTLNKVRLWHDVWIEVVLVPCFCRTQYWWGSARLKHDVWTRP